MAIIVPFSKAKPPPQQGGPVPITDPFAQMALAQTAADRKKDIDGKAAD